MIMPRRELKWAAAGFIGGFLLCYLLIGASQFQRPASSHLARITPPTVWPPVPAVSGVQLTNTALPEFRIESPPRWRGPEPTPDRRHPGYSLDLIDDTHHQ
jgi:hypothetical protein